MSNLDLQRIRDLGLNAENILVHEKRVTEYLSQPDIIPPEYVDHCTLDNLGIISINSVSEFVDGSVDARLEVAIEQWFDEGIVSIVLAAGAATRFLSGLKSEKQFGNQHGSEKITKYSEQLEHKHHFSRICFNWNRGSLRSRFLRMLKDKLTTHPFHGLSQRELSGIDFKRFSEILEQMNTRDFLHAEQFALNLLINEMRHLPKLLIPLNDEGDSFLDYLTWQHKNMLPRTPLIMVVCPEHVERTADAARRAIGIGFASGIISNKIENILFATQEHDLDTIRFLKTGEPLKEDNGGYSAVPGGHGEIIKLFNSFSQKSENGNCLVVQTNDNIFGKCGRARSDYRHFLSFFYILKGYIDALRREVSYNLLENEFELGDIFVRSQEAKSAIEKLQEICRPKFIDASITGTLNSLDFCYLLLERLFFFPQRQIPSTRFEKLVLLQKYLSRPIVMIGVVERNREDVGGFPVFTAKSSGEKIRICLEGSRFSGSDMKLSNFQESATHFNSGIAIVETKIAISGEKTHQHEFTQVDFNAIQNDEFYLVSKKKYKGITVLYHETALYELLSNSENTNCLFVEAPRALFNPNKNILTVLGKPRSDFGF